jgi:hypothetical protein
MLLPIPDDILQAQARDRLHSLLLSGLGVTAAAVSAAFAAYMIATTPFSGPGRMVADGSDIGHGLVRALGAPPHLGVSPGSPAGAQALDYTPVGSIPSPAGPHDGPPARPVLSDFAVRDAFDDTALVEAHGTLQVVRPGSVMDEAGIVQSIARQGRGWVVTTDRGVIVQRR